MFVDFSKAFDSVHREKLNEIILANGIHEEIASTIMMLYQNSKSMVRSPDGDTDFFDIIAGVLQGDSRSTARRYLSTLPVHPVLGLRLKNFS